MVKRPFLVSVLVMALVLTGCFGNATNQSPNDDAAFAPMDASSIDTVLFTDALGPGAALPLAGFIPTSASVEHELSLDPNVTWMRVEATGQVALFVDDPDGNRWCGVRTGKCDVLVPHGSAGAATGWTIRLTSLSAADQQVYSQVRQYDTQIAYGDDGLGPAPYTIHTADRNGGEPTLAVVADGSVLVVAGNDVLRLDPRGKWTEVTPPVDTQVDATLDPFLTGDPQTGRVYVSQLAACQRISWTDDAGASWTSNPVACGGPDQHHQKLEVGPDHLGLGMRVLHMLTMNLASWVATDDVIITAARSTDSGASWSQNPAMVPPLHGMEARAIGNIDIADDGSVHAIAYLCDAFNGAPYRGIGAGRSDDGGATWAWQKIAPGGGSCQGIDPGIAVQGNSLHVVGWDASAGTPTLWHVRGDVTNETWTEPQAIPTAGLRSFVLADVTATATGAVAAFLATPDTDLGPNEAPTWARWFPYVAVFDERAARAPGSSGWTVARLEDHPVQIGRICMEGPSCLDRSRNLLDFIDIQTGPDGRAHVAYADGCPDTCSFAWESRAALLKVAVENTGSTLGQGTSDPNAFQAWDAGRPATLNARFTGAA